MTSAGPEGEKKAFRARVEAEDWMRDGRESLDLELDPESLVVVVVLALGLEFSWVVFGLLDDDGGGLSLGLDMLYMYFVGGCVCTPV